MTDNQIAGLTLGLYVAIDFLVEQVNYLEKECTLLYELKIEEFINRLGN